MIQIFVFTKRSLVLIFLASSVAHSLAASSNFSFFETQEQFIVIQEPIQISWNVEKLLIDKGLEQEIAHSRAQQLFSSPTLKQKLDQLLSTQELDLNKEDLLQELSSYALFEKKCDLHSYDGLVGFVQKFHPTLSTTQRDLLKKIALS